MLRNNYRKEQTEYDHYPEKRPACAIIRREFWNLNITCRCCKTDIYVVYQWGLIEINYVSSEFKPWIRNTRWRHQMETFSALLALCAGNPPVPGEFSARRPVTRSFDVFFDLRLNKRLSKQPWEWWFETPSCSLWRHCNENPRTIMECNYSPIS